MSAARNEILSLYSRGLRGTIRNNVAAYGYSVMISSSGITVAHYLGFPAPWELFLATAVYVLASGVEMSLAERTERGG